MSELLKPDSSVLSEIGLLNRQAGFKCIIVDDDPTGCQTVSGVRLMLEVDEQRIRQILDEERQLFILTNSRAKTADYAYQVNFQIANLLSDTNCTLISRGDSTLRGHFSHEITGLIEGNGHFDGVVFCPFFLEGNRITENDHHYILNGDERIPVAESEFAKDVDFGYSHSNLRDWVAEQSNGKWKAAEILSITREDIAMGTRHLVEKLDSVVRGGMTILNATSYEELNEVVLALAQVEGRGKRFLYRTAASFVRSRLGQSERPLIQPKRLTPGHGGLMVVGSYVAKTTDQLQHLQKSYGSELHFLAVSIDQLINHTDRYIDEITATISRLIRQGRDTVLYTPREFRRSVQDEHLPDKLNTFLYRVMGALQQKPSFLVTKGGITSHDVARHGLNVTEAIVTGQVLPGVPVWELCDGHFPDLNYVVFPGNVGSESSLSDLYQKIKMA